MSAPISISEQRAYFCEVEPEHFEWQTQGAYIAATEAALLDAVALGPGERLLEIGCGEGANLFHLTRTDAGREGARAGRIFGVDASSAKVRFCADRTGALTAVADAAHLPFAAARFDTVLVRDLLHHVPDRIGVLAEATRVLVPGGRITLIEPNRWNPLIAAMAAAIPAERGMLASTVERAKGELAAAGFVDLRVERRQPLPLSRVVLHYKMGAPAWGDHPQVAFALERLERACAALPANLWAYFVIRARTPRRKT